ncbi:MAG: SEC-C domain-containing protein [Deltaproteobacteria bacterium]|nr:SEC-C domain-containing protein [Deltaproteobacteria bacterium]
MPTTVTKKTVSELAERVRSGGVDPRVEADAALALSDASAAAAWVLAGAVAGRPPEPDQVLRLLPDVPQSGLVMPLIRCANGDRLKLALDAVAEGRMPAEFDVLALLLATELLGGEPPPSRFVPLVKQASRRASRPVSELALAYTLCVCEANEKGRPLELAELPGADRIRGLARHALDEPLLDVIDTLPSGGLTMPARRAARRLGANEPCHCGSGKKYKRCCAGRDAQRNSDPSPVEGMTRGEYLRSCAAQMSPEDIRRLSVQEVVNLDFASLPTPSLVVVLDGFAQRSRWDVAEQVLDLLCARPDAAKVGQAARLQVASLAFAGGAQDFATRQLQRVDLDLLTEDDRWSAGVLLNLATPSAETLTRLDEAVLQCLRTADHEGVHVVSQLLLAKYPALGLMVGRSALTADQAHLSLLLLRAMEVRRAELGLPFDEADHAQLLAMLDKRIERTLERRSEESARELASEAEELRGRLSAAEARSAELAESLKRQERLLARPAVPVAPQPAPRDAGRDHETERRRLQAKVEDLKRLISEGNEERRRLRGSLEELAGKFADERDEDDPPAPEDDEREEPEDEAGGVAIFAPRGVLNLRLSEAVETAIQRLPLHVARKALATFASLAGGEPLAWQQTKRLQRFDNLCRVRVGIHYRALFETCGRDLVIHELVNRQGLDAALKRLASK